MNKTTIYDILKGRKKIELIDIHGRRLRSRLRRRTPSVPNGTIETYFQFFCKLSKRFMSLKGYGINLR